MSDKEDAESQNTVNGSDTNADDAKMVGVADVNDESGEEEMEVDEEEESPDTALDSEQDDNDDAEDSQDEEDFVEKENYENRTTNGSTDDLNDEEKDDQQDGNVAEEQASDDGEAATKDPEPSKPKELTDEYGRPLSAYEIMRLERIKRNQAYLAKLGLESNAETGKTKTLLGDTAAKKAKAKPKSKQKVELRVMRRSSVSRRTKTKAIDYTDKPIARKEDKLPKKEKKAKEPKPKKPKSEKQQKREDRLPLFIYREFKTIETTRNKNLRTAEKLHRAVEKEVRMAKQAVENLERKTRKLKDRETRNDMVPIIREVVKRKSDIAKALKKMEKSIKHSVMSEEERKKELVEEMEEAKERFPQAMKEVQTELGQMLLERLPPALLEGMKNVDENGGKKLKSKGEKGGRADSDGENEDREINGRKGASSKATSKLPLPENLDFEELKKVEQNLKVRVQKSRNVGGPVTAKLAASVNKKWLENDVSVAAGCNEYVPQVGDIVLYYPCAHYEFLKKYPDIRSKKNRLALRRTLWDRAIDQKKEQEKQLKRPKKDESDDDEKKENPSSKRKKNISEKPWWTIEWMSGIQRGAGRYPILCRVEKEFAEFPYDQESQTEIRRLQYDTKKAKSGGGTTYRVSEKEGRQKPSRFKPLMCLAVTLKPLAPVIPPSESGSEPALSLPPIFSVLTFPAEKEPFLVPFAFAYRSAFMFQEGDEVKLLGKDGIRRSAEVVSVDGDGFQAFESLAEKFQDILEREGGIAISSLQKLDSLIANAFSQHIHGCSLKEVDFRAAIQTILYQIHIRKMQEKSLTGGQTEQRVRGLTNVNRVNATILVSKLASLVQSSIPRWGKVKIKLESSEDGKFVCPWQLEVSGNDDRNIQGGALSAALAPNIMISSDRLCSGGFVHRIDESLRVQLESVLKYLMENDEDFFPFISPITEGIASEYSRFVPLSMCFKRILKRLKKHKVKYLKSSAKNEEFFLEEQAHGGNESCYYRSIGSLYSDISDLFQNCLIYNSPDSDIVLSAFHVTNYLKIVVNKVLDDWGKERVQKIKAELTQIINAESAARGEVIFQGRKKTSIPANEVDEYGFVFHRALDRSWMSSTLPDASCHSISVQEKSVNSRFWIPQTGDRVIYNRMMHGKFINGHLDILKNNQRTLPSILPPSNKKIEKLAKGRKKGSNDGETGVDAELYQYWLGTIVWIRAVFPNSEASQTSKDLSGLYAIGIKFHYKWLAKSVHVVYWKPCSNALDMDDNLQDGPGLCAHCGLSLDQSFLSPAWIGAIDRILPPYPISLAHSASPPRLSTDKIKTIGFCLNELKNRVINGTAVDAFDPHHELLEIFGEKSTDIPQRFKYIFEERNCEKVQDIGQETSASVMKRLSTSGFIAPWTFVHDEVRPKVSTRGNKTGIEKDVGTSVPFHYAIIANPWLSLDFINERLRGEFYRTTVAIVNDLREALMNVVLYTIKERIRSKRLTETSEKIVLKAIIETFGVDIDTYMSESSNEAKIAKCNVADKNGNEINAHDAENANQSSAINAAKPKKTSKISGLNHQERAVVSDIIKIFKLYSTAIVICTETSIAETACGLGQLSVSHTDGAPNADQGVAKQNLKWMLSSLGPDKQKFRKPLAPSGEFPNVNVFVKIAENGISMVDEETSSPCESLLPSLILEPSDYERKPALVSLLCPSLHEFTVKVSIKFQDKQLERVIEPDEYRSSPSLQNFLKPVNNRKALRPIKINVVSDCFTAGDILPTCTNNVVESIREKNGDVEETKVLRTASVIDDMVDCNENDADRESHADDLEEVDMSKPITFVPADYNNNTSLVRALFCRSKRRQPCLRCVLSKKGLFTCRVKFAHSNIDPLWIDYFRCNGGVDGILAILDPDYQPQTEMFQSTDSQDEDAESTLDQSEHFENKGDDDNLKSAIESANEVRLKAIKAQELASVLLMAARKDMERPISLSPEFMHGSFTVDPDDGHFEICPKCGRGGDVICCDTCEMVSHPKCAGMDEIPEGDWHCEACIEKTNNAVDETEFASALDDVEEAAEKLELMVEDLKSARKQAPIEIGTKLFRKFHGKTYLGWVIQLPSETMDYYRVQYEDGDDEDFTMDEMRPFIAAYNKKKSTDDAELPTKNGRPTKYTKESTVDTSKNDQTAKRRGRPRKNRDQSPVEKAPARKRGRSRKAVQDRESDMPVKKRRRGHTPKNGSPSESIRQVPRKRGRPRKNTNSEVTQIAEAASKPMSVRKRGRPRKDATNGVATKVEAQSDATPARKLGRPRKSSAEPEKKRGRGRPRKNHKKVESPNAGTSYQYPDELPNPGHVDKDRTYYCAKENDTTVKIASLIGCDSWLDVAYIPENLERFPALQNKKVKLRQGTLVRIAEAGFVVKKVSKLLE